MEAFFVSTAVVALAECGDKTQLLALALAARLRRPIPIALGILAATLLNHAAAGFVGHLLSGVLEGDWQRWVLGVSFIAMAAWTLIPDRHDGAAAREAASGWAAFVTTSIAFFLVEMGDKTQIATVALAARFDLLAAVVIGTTAGMMLANAPVVWLGHRLADRLPLRALRLAASLLFAVLGVLTLAGVSL
jgi:putative Ca2+/H+ antiporter (TMEM165/GDT1 family)